MSTPFPTALTAADSENLAHAHNLLIAMDFDGTLAPLHTDPTQCRAVPGAIDALLGLAELPGTTAMILSGRNLQLLGIGTQLDPWNCGQLLLVGSHGAQPADHPTPTLTHEQHLLLSEIGAAAQQCALKDPGMWVETKTLAVGLHTRGAHDPHVAQAALDEFRRWASARPGAHLTEGKKILEVSVSSVTKGSYLKEFLRSATPAFDAVAFAGDDTTDETAMSILNPATDLGIKVGDGDTAAHRRVASPEELRDFLQLVFASRSRMKKI